MYQTFINVMFYLPASSLPNQESKTYHNYSAQDITDCSQHFHILFRSLSKSAQIKLCCTSIPLFLNNFLVNTIFYILFTLLFIDNIETTRWDIFWSSINHLGLTWLPQLKSFYQEITLISTSCPNILFSPEFSARAQQDVHVDFSGSELVKCMKYNRRRTEANQYQDHAVARWTIAVPVSCCQREQGLFTSQSTKTQPLLFK